MRNTKQLFIQACRALVALQPGSSRQYRDEVGWDLAAAIRIAAPYPKAAEFWLGDVDWAYVRGATGENPHRKRTNT